MRPKHVISRLGWQGKFVLIGIIIPKGVLNPLPRGTVLELTGEIGSDYKGIGKWRLSPKNVWLCMTRIIMSKDRKGVVLEEWIQLDAFQDDNRIRRLVPLSPLDKAQRSKRRVERIWEDIKRSVYPI